ncbi:MAG: hypothetical protein IKP65_00380, partial [Alphaproteobacteria bacterium]|nr:hypothetical protein [Alphaproteobacteria bacterium]
KDEETLGWLELYDKIYKIKKKEINTINNKIWNQKFYNFMPWLFQNYNIDRNDGINVGHWNYSRERNLT